MAEMTARRRVGRPRIGPQITARLDDSAVEELIRRADRRGQPMAVLFREAVELYLSLPDDHPVQEQLIA